MSEGKHTPGPWIVFVDRGGDSAIFSVLPAGRVGEIADNIENGYDANLTAAAPELLAAVKATEALDDRDDCPECEGDGEPEACSLCFPKADDARLLRRAAIAKAEGRSGKDQEGE